MPERRSPPAERCDARGSPAANLSPRASAKTRSLSSNVESGGARGCPTSNLFHRRSPSTMSVSSSTGSRSRHADGRRARRFPPPRVVDRLAANTESVSSSAESLCTRTESVSPSTESSSTHSDSPAAREFSPSNLLHRRSAHTERGSTQTESGDVRGSEASNLLHQCSSNTESVSRMAESGDRHADRSADLSLGVARLSPRRARLSERYPTSVRAGASHSDGPSTVTARARTHTKAPDKSPWSSTSARRVSGSGFHSSPSIRSCHS